MEKIEEYLKNVINEKRPIQFKTYIAGQEFINKVHTGLSIILNYKNYEHLSSPLMFILRELITNANKANMKRVYFNLIQMNIDENEHYAEGIKDFGSKLKTDYFSLEKYLKNHSMHTRVIFKEYADSNFSIYIANNAIATKEEIQRVNQKLNRYKNSRNDPNAILNLIDETEGAGMGLFLSLQLLEKVGIKCDSFKFGVGNNATIAKINFNYDEVAPPPYNVFAKAIIDEIEKLPEFPEKMKKILSMLENKDLEMKNLADQVKTDPALSAELLKYVNSSGVIINRKIGTIKEALNFVGVNGLKSLIYSHSAMSIMDKKFGTVKDVWEHSYKTAIMAEKIAHLKKFKNANGEFYTAGLLHDIGKIVLMGIDNEKAKKIEKICNDRGVDLPVMEEISMGISHAVVGGKIAKFWQFPDSLTNAITYHHDIMMNMPDKAIVYTVYLANYFANLAPEQLPELLAIDINVKNFFKFKAEKDIMSLYENLTQDES